MSQNLTPTMQLTALVLSAPPTKPSRCRSEYPYCAFVRASVARDGNEPRSLERFALELGFSYAEYVGVMRGWDGAAGEAVLFDDDEVMTRQPHSVARGEQLGAKLHAMVCTS